MRPSITWWLLDKFSFPLNLKSTSEITLTPW